MIQERGIERVAKQYGKSERTVSQWQKGPDAQRPSADIRRRVSRSGRKYSGAAFQPEVGQPAVVDRDVLRLRQELNEQYARQRERAIEQARTPADRQVAQAMPTEADTDLIRTLDVQKREMLDREASGEDTGEDSELYDDWADWRDALNASYGAGGEQ